MSYIPPNPNGQATSANSSPVVVASDQSALPVSAASLPLPSGAATAVKQPALGTAGTASADVLTIQGITSMTALKVDGSAVTQPVSGTITANIGTVGTLAADASVTGLQVSQGSATSGQKGNLVQGAVTTGAPSYTTAQTSPLSLTTAGALRVDGSAVTQPVSGTVSVTSNSAVNVAQMNGVATSMGNGTTDTGTQRVTISNDSTGKVAATQSGTWTVGSNSATGSAVPANAFYNGLSDGSGNLVGWKQSANGTNSSGTGVAATGIVAQFDDVSPTTITENNFGNVRMSNNRNIYGTVRDAAGNERGANVDASNNLQVSIKGGAMPAGTTLTTSQNRITTNSTTTVIGSTAYISSIIIVSEVAGTTSTLTIQDKQGTPRPLVNGFTTVAVTTTPTVLNFQTPVIMTSGIDIVTAGVAAATVDVWINYYA